MMGKCVTAVSQIFFFFAELTRDSRKDVSLESNGQTVLTVFVEQTYFFITRGTFPNRSLLQFFEILVSDCIKCRFLVLTTQYIC